ncbi:ATP-binding protein [Yoonia sp. 2307UL14-13]|uniref:ATP-binding protein n=1 Tax=Yoonia sp. 2307UL14-13 TaxID=3126506 RepID=UPI0030AC5691
MSRRISQKWRPPLALVLGGTLAAVFFLPIIGIGYFQLAGGILGWAETSWMIGWMAMVATLVLGYLLWRLVLQPVRALTEYAQREGVVAPPARFGTPEFSQLGRAVIGMTKTLQGREAVLRSYADHVTHELKSPLTAIRGAAELLEHPDLVDEDRARMLANIGGAVDRMEALLDGQRALARAQEPLAAGSCLLSDVVSGDDVAILQDGEVPLSSDVVGMIATHLIGNARAHGATHVTFDLQSDRLVISDDGPGVSKGNRDRIFDPFFTTRRAGGGTGMGLPIVRRMLQAQGAEIMLIDGPGATFEIRF